MKEATDAAIQKDLEEKYKPRVLAGIQEFVRDFGERQGYGLETVSNETADKMMQEEFKTFKELTKYNNANFGNDLYILYRFKYDENLGDIYTIETIIYNDL